MPWDKDLQAVERAIAVVNAEYDAFLYGSASKPPIESRRNVERLIRQLSVQEPETSAERFRFSTIQGRWSTLEDRWERLQAEKEAGRRPGLYGHFRPSRGAEAGMSPPATPNAPDPASVRETGEPPADSRRALYEKYVAARTARGEIGEGFNFERFMDSLKREENRLKARFGGAEVEFDVAERDGQVKLVARKKQ
jgi:hypothetical protein